MEIDRFPTVYPQGALDVIASLVDSEPGVPSLSSKNHLQSREKGVESIQLNNRHCDEGKK